MNGEPCPVCDSTDWYTDYDFNGEDERRVDRCEQCDWPPPYPVTVEEWRQHCRESFVVQEKRS